ncbi:MAG: Holliday junction resolvase RuvX [Betaproteobacteria bacterium]|nr:Holliday junction resolvase RuvX [Betaproteobacteria bacterium]
MSDELKAKGSKTTHHPSPFTHHPSTGTVLAFDFGTKRIGVAVGDFETRLAHPLATVASAENRARFAAIERLIAEWRPVRLVVGLPARADGTEHPVGKLARRFAQRLQGRFGIRTELVDERLTSHEAEGLLRASGARGARLKAGLDPVAAQRILNAYFESVARESGRAGERESGKS